MKSANKTFCRGAVRRETAKPVLILFPNELLEGVNQAVVLLDTDRSKFVRNAVREQLAKIKTTEPVQALP